MSERQEEDWSTLMGNIVAAFSPGAPIQEQEVFAGRTAQLEKLTDAVRQRGRHAIVFGERGVGKTSLANVTRLMLHSPIRQLVAVRVNGAADDTFETLVRKIFKRLTYRDETGKRRIEEDYAGKTITPDDVQLELESFSEDQVTVIVIDEFDRIRDTATRLATAELLKMLSDYSVNATVIIVGIAESVSSLIAEHESITRSLIHVHMPRMSQDELAEIIVKRYRMNGVRVSEEALWKMTYLARGLPYYAHLLGMHAAKAAIAQRRDLVDGPEVDTALGASIDEIDNTVMEDYLRAVVSQKGEETLYARVLLACALATTDELGRFQQAAVGEPLSKITGKQYSATTFAFHMNKFCDGSRGKILERLGETRNYRYRFREAVMQPFVILKGLRDGLIDDDVAEIYASRRQLRLSIDL